MNINPHCIFCKIAVGQIPAQKIVETQKALAFLDISPHAKGHTVVVPKSHAVTLLDLGQDFFEDLLVVIKESQQKLDASLKPQGYNVGWNHGKAGGQAVAHLHIHILPRYTADGGTNMHGIVNTPGDLSVEEVFELLSSNKSD